MGIISSHQFSGHFYQIFFSLAFAWGGGGPKPHARHQPQQRGDTKRGARGDPFPFDPGYSWVTRGGPAFALATMRITTVPSAPPSHLTPQPCSPPAKTPWKEKTRTQLVTAGH